jgi:hypothetical protein
LYLVKWRDLPYTSATWETREDLNDEEKVEDYYRHDMMCVRYASSARPRPSQYVKMDKMTFKNGNELRPYQQEGVDWLVYNWYQVWPFFISGSLLICY